MIDLTRQAISHLGTNEIASELASLFEKMPKGLSNTLSEAHSRYEHLIGITSAGFDEDILKLDRVKYRAFYLNSSLNGLPMFVDDDCTRMMSELYNLPPLLCRMYVVNDFNWTAASGFTDNPVQHIRDSCVQLKPLFENAKDVETTIEFLIEKEAGQLTRLTSYLAN